MVRKDQMNDSFRSCVSRNQEVDGESWFFNDRQSRNKLRKRVRDARLGCALSRQVVSWPHVDGATRFPPETLTGTNDQWQNDEQQQMKDLSREIRTVENNERQPKTT